MHKDAIIETIKELPPMDRFEVLEQIDKEFSRVFLADPAPVVMLSQGRYQVYWLVPGAGLCEIGSKVALWTGIDDKFHRRLVEVIEANQTYLLGKEGVQNYRDTVDDRRLVNVIAHGGTMVENGEIIDPLTGERI